MANFWTTFVKIGFLVTPTSSHSCNCRHLQQTIHYYYYHPSLQPERKRSPQILPPHVGNAYNIVSTYLPPHLSSPLSFYVLACSSYLSLSIWSILFVGNVWYSIVSIYLCSPLSLYMLSLAISFTYQILAKIQFGIPLSCSNFCSSLYL